MMKRAITLQVCGQKVHRSLKRQSACAEVVMRTRAVHACAHHSTPLALHMHNIAVTPRSGDRMAADDAGLQSLQQPWWPSLLRMPALWPIPKDERI